MKVIRGTTLVILILVVAMVPGAWTIAFSQDQQGHGAAHHGAQPSIESGESEESETASTLAYRAVNDRMHEAMGIAFTGDADVDFVKGMIPHHQGAIEMAQVVMQYGQDPEIRALAEDIIKAQKDEIDHMRAWLKARGHDEW